MNEGSRLKESDNPENSPEVFTPEKMTHIKLDVNNLLFRYLPGDLTINRMEFLAIKIFDIIASEWEEKP